MLQYNPSNWYWIVATNPTKVYSSATGTYLPTTDAIYQEWLANGNAPSGAATDAALLQVLGAIGVKTVMQTPVGLAAYASAKQGAVMNGGISVDVGTKAAPVIIAAGTDTASLILLQGAYTMAQANLSATFQWVQDTGASVQLTSAQVIAIFNAVTAFLQSTFATLGQVLAAIKAGTIATQADVDEPPSTIPAWPANS